jgi:hypothetical protein
MALTFRHLTLLLFLLPGAYLPAQISSARAPTGLSFTVYSPDESPVLNQLYYLQGPKAPLKLTFETNRRSASISLPGGPKPLVFGVERLDPVTQQKIYIPVAEAVWPETATQVLVVFTVPEKTTPQIQANASDDGPNAFPLRTVRFFNATGVGLLGKIAAFEGEILSGISPAYSYPVTSENPLQIGTFPLALALNDSTEGARLLFNGTGEAWPLSRSLMFILPPAKGSNDVQLRVLVDSPNPTGRKHPL